MDVSGNVPGNTNFSCYKNGGGIFQVFCLILVSRKNVERSCVYIY